MKADIIRLPRQIASPIGDAGRHVRSIGLALVVCVLLSVIVTFAIQTGLTPIVPTEAVTRVVIIVNSILLLMLVLLIGWELVGLGLDWRSGKAGARLHWRVISMFGLIAAIPALLVTLLASITLDQGLDRWFETRTRTIVQNAAEVGAAYLQEHVRALRGDALAMASDTDRVREIFESDPSRFDAFLLAQARVRQLPVAYILKFDRSVVTSAKVITEWDNILMPPEDAMESAKNDGAAVITPGQSNQVGVVVALKEYEDMYLYVARALDPKVISQVRLAEGAASSYSQMDKSRHGTQVAFAVLFLGVTLALLLAAIWVGIGFANRLVAPIQRLIVAADYVSKGNLSVELPIRPREGDLAQLGETFNKMTSELRSQRAELVEANEQIDSRRRFTEAVLSGVNSGVVGIGSEGEVTIANRAATQVLDIEEDQLIGQLLGEEVPELAPIVAAALADRSRVTQHHVALMRAGRERNLNVRVNPEAGDEIDGNAVVTIDDITDLVSAQRSSAWADVARRIAHEIKNPLTPIQLSAERIRRRFGKFVGEGDKAVFDQCVDTIIRQVGDIERMVNEFSSFARMPKPQHELRNIAETVREAVFLISVAHPDIEFESHLPDAPVMGRFDPRLMLQAFANVIKNATEAIAGLPEDITDRGHVDIRVLNEGREIVVEVIDNGVGLPLENRNRLLEPYVTTREKGTGLGLAIVRKIMEDHGGRIELLDSPAVATGGRGAMMRLILPAVLDDAGAISGGPTDVNSDQSRA